VRFGAHLPLAVLREREVTAADLTAYAARAEELGFQILGANDHLVFTRPFLDCLTSLAAVISSTREMALMTTISLPVVRGPVQLAKALTTMATLSQGRVIAGVGPGSHRGDYAAAGIEFDERWPRFDEAIRALRHLLGAASEPYSGHFYRTDGLDLEPKPKSDQRVPIWIGSWGSDIGLKRIARYADGWLASAYNTDPVKFADCRARLDEYLTASGRSAGSFPNAIATMFFHLTESRAEAERVVRIVAAFLNRSEELIRDRLLIGSWENSAAKIIAFRDAGAQALLVWPVEDDLKQLEKFRSRFMTAAV
jgi:alkanesulfonate monooxygenase SsuD/methylene tetrahydromethanopterin reductase-like flavin-dependent oxidoreductase (luciferase family)